MKHALLKTTMKNRGYKVKNIVVTFCFIIIISGFMLANVIVPDAEFSLSERRRLSEFPEFSLEKLLSGDLFGEFEEYTLDQFVLRDTFRGLKAIGKYYLLNQKDNNKIYIIDGNINKIEYPLDERSVYNAARKLNEIYNKYLEGMNVSYAIIPDKNYFLAKRNGYLSLDYDKMVEIMNQNVKNMKYIDLFSVLSIEDFYRTDIHWSQDRITGMADVLLNEMGNEVRASDARYSREEKYPFYGSYYGQAALKLEPDTMVYLTNNTIENAVVYDHIDKTYSKVYMHDRFESIDSYDFFLSGAKSLITITNPSCTNGRELVLFRDSFGSSIAPLLLEGYSKITLVDLRYFATDLLGEYMEFTEGQDILFLYNVQILNNSAMLK